MGVESHSVVFGVSFSVSLPSAVDLENTVSKAPARSLAVGRGAETEFLAKNG
jgi:hypothetical protein